MLSPVALYPLVVVWLQAMGVVTHPTGLRGVAEVLTALLTTQSLRSATLMRALLSATGVPARQRYKRLARFWQRPWLSPAWVTPCLVRAVLALVPPDPAGTRTAGLTHLALDSVRCGAWEVFTLTVGWHGRVLPVGWAVLPYPWPKKRFTPTVCALIEQVAMVWPDERPAHVVADRAVPSRPVFPTLRQVGWGWTIRLRVRTGITVHGERQWVRDLVRTAPPGHWLRLCGLFGSGMQGIPGYFVVGRGLLTVPWHQRDPGSVHQRTLQFTRRHDGLTSKHPRQAPDAAQETDRWVILFRSHPSYLAALDSYRRRWPIEGSYRDAQGGGDGRHGWDLERVLTRLRDATHVERVVGLWALGAVLQTWVGHQVGQVDAAPEVQVVRRQWTTTGRLSVWTRGQFALQDRSGHLRAWLVATLTERAEQVAAAPPAHRPVARSRCITLSEAQAQPRALPVPAARAAA